jgi:tRNA(Ile)-lysidine synthase
MQEKQKLSDFFINEKIPACLRDRWPLMVTASDQIAWVIGLRIAEAHRVQESSQQVLEVVFDEG